jgi:predicted enzyme related to lactoylglutathione lyase
MPRPTHFELPADDPERVVQFYSTVFGWQVEKWDGPAEYWLVSTGEGPGIDGGIGRRAEGEAGVVNSISVTDLDATLTTVKAQGGRVTRDKMPIPGVGWLAYCLDTEGNAFGLMQSDPSAGQ